MYNTSQKFKNNIYAPERTAKARITFDISDVTAAGDVTSIDATTQAPISDKAQLINKKRDMTYNLATFETNRFKLDGTFSFPDDNMANNGEMGFCSDNLSLPDGTFNTFPTITFNFGTTHSSVGLTISFDRTNNEYATDFNIKAYDTNNVLITSVDVTDNTESLCTPIGLLLNYKKVVLTIKKWSKGDRRARVLEVDFGIVRVYTDDNLINMNLVEEVDLLTATLPSAEFKFTVDNSGREFNILNPTGFYKYLQERQQVIAEIGVDVGNGLIEYVPIGNYLLYEWQSDEGSLTATFTARTNLDLMAGFDYENLYASPTSLGYMAQVIFAQCGITNYSIDSTLWSITTNALVKKANCKDILQMIAIAGCANIYVTRDNIITVKVSPMAVGEPVDAITLDNSYQEPKITLDKVIRAVEVAYWANIDTSAVVTVNTGSTAGDVLKLENNTLINTAERATAVANWLLRQVWYRAKYNVNWRGNPAHELTDVVSIENSYGASMSAFVTRNEINYAGYLSGRTEAKGMVN